MVFPIVGEGFVEGGVFFFGDLVGFSHPDWFIFVYCFEFLVNFLNFSGSLFLFLFFFDFDIFTFFLFLRFFFFFIISDFLFSGLFYLNLDFKTDKFRVLFDKFLESLFFKEFKIVWF